MNSRTLRRFLPLALLALVAAPLAAQRHGGGSGGGSFGGARSSYSGGVSHSFSGGGAAHYGGGFRSSATPQYHSVSQGRPSGYAASPSRYSAGPSRTTVSSRPMGSTIGSTISSAAPRANANGYVANRYSSGMAGVSGASTGSANSGLVRNSALGARTGTALGAGVPANRVGVTGFARGFDGRRDGRSHFFIGFGLRFGCPSFFPWHYWYLPSLFWWGWPYYWSDCYYGTYYCDPYTWWWPNGVYEPRYYRYYYVEQPADPYVVNPTPIVQPSQAVPPEEIAKQQVAIGDSEFQNGRYREAAQAYEKARQTLPGDASLDLLLADAVFASGNYHQAAYLIGNALRRQPDLARATPDKRAQYGDQKQFDAQLATLQKYMAEHPYDAMAQLALGYNLRLAGRADEAQRALQHVLEIDPDNATAKVLLQPPAAPPAAPGGPVKKAV